MAKGDFKYSQRTVESYSRSWRLYQISTGALLFGGQRVRQMEMGTEPNMRVTPEDPVKFLRAFILTRRKSLVEHILEKGVKNADLSDLTATSPTVKDKMTGKEQSLLSFLWINFLRKDFSAWGLDGVPAGRGTVTYLSFSFLLPMGMEVRDLIEFDPGAVQHDELSSEQIWAMLDAIKVE